MQPHTPSLTQDLPGSATVQPRVAPSLRSLVVSSGSYVAARHVLGLAIGVIGVVLLTRLIGPENYGVYAGAVAVVGVLSSIGRVGTHIYLVRQSTSPEQLAANQAFSLLTVTSVGMAGVGLALSFPLGHWLGDERFVHALRVLIAVLPLTILSIPAIATLERNLSYPNLTRLEIVGMIFFYACALPLAALGLGFWAPVLGFAASQFLQFAGACYLAHYRPVWIWSRSLAADMTAYGLRQTASDSLWQVRKLVNPVVVGRYAGLAAVGHVALAIRLVETVGFLGGASYRLVLASFSKLQHDRQRLQRALELSLWVQVVAIGVPLAACVATSRWLLPLVFGAAWRPVLVPLAFVAPAFLVATLFSMYGAALYVLGDVSGVLKFNLVHVVLFAGSAFLLVPLLGLWGYGTAEMVALAAYPLLRRRCRAHLRLNDAAPALSAFALAPIMFSPLLQSPIGLLLAVPAAALAASRTVRGQVGEVWSFVRPRTP